jgi:hypothetical protein
MQRDRIRWLSSLEGKLIVQEIIWAIFRVYGWKLWCPGSHSTLTDRSRQSVSNRIGSTISLPSCHCIIYPIHKLIIGIWLVIVSAGTAIHCLYFLNDNEGCTRCKSWSYFCKILLCFCSRLDDLLLSIIAIIIPSIKSNFTKQQHYCFFFK